ncbi:cationic amino acid transporter 2 [Dermatophagoides farinae]|uniref:High affinity cationic amino acid transporter 1 n=1 Tax=Dermatophagoides farinae TaxID=6954 RepID=A0A922IFE4_DERFA|nr:cationic amino acid transporter 2-like [Dermatophagoides farinae]KAH7642311.1 high affinity cationic amino acid transporter 1-like [Dermatophagoides farinae]KAH9529521.1 High affinity cationic amino acid transporter 1 [Dermatophagoides farinae]
MIFLRNFIKSLLRRKRIDSSQISNTRLDRCLTTLDLSALGIGSTLGLGIYVLAGDVASRTSGPAVTISFFIAAIASVFAGLCYAEFGARVPKAGSAYVYSYVTVGEFMAFVIGWNLVLEYVIGTASVARGYSNYVDSLVNGTVQANLRYYMPIDVPGLSAYPDFLAFLITFSLTIMLVIGVKESTRFNSVFTGINLLVVLFVVIAGSFHIDFHNWNLSKDEVPENAGKGGFMPYGFSGMMSGAATCFYAFIGFDVIATTGEEAKNPQRSIPISIVLSLLFVFLAYFGISAVQTLMLPYYLQTEEITKGAPLPYVFEYVGWPVAKWIISIGALTGLSTSLLGAMFPLPRVLYSMASDGVIFRSFADINPRTKTPILATLISGIFAGAMAALFDVKELADMMSIGTLLAYTLVSISVLILRFSHEIDNIDDDINRNITVEMKPLRSKYQNSDEKFDNRSWCAKLFNTDRMKEASAQTSRISTNLVMFITTVLIIFDALLVYLEDRLVELETNSFIIILAIFIVLVFSIISLAMQPRSTKKLSFQVPWVPLIPILSMFVNFYLMFKLSTTTWIRFAIWMAIGLSIYFFYGIWHSNERSRRYEARQNSAN